MTAFQNINSRADHTLLAEAIRLANDGRSGENSLPTSASVKTTRLLLIEPENRLLS